MVEELRKIILTREEIQQAVDSYRRSVPDFLPHGEILRCHPADETSYQVTVRLAYGKNNQDLDFNFKLADFLGPIIQFCVENNIILPRNSRKCVKMEADRVCLYIVMETPQGQTLAPPQALAKNGRAPEQSIRT